MSLPINNQIPINNAISSFIQSNPGAVNSALAGNQSLSYDPTTDRLESIVEDQKQIRVVSFPEDLFSNVGGKQIANQSEVKNFMEIEIHEVLGQRFDTGEITLQGTWESVASDPIELTKILDLSLLGPWSTHAFGASGSSDAFNKLKDAIKIGNLDAYQNTSDADVSKLILNLKQLSTDTTTLKNRKTNKLVKIWLYEPGQLNTEYNLKYTETDLSPTKRLFGAISSTINDNSIPGSLAKQVLTNEIGDIIKNATQLSGINNAVGGDIDFKNYFNSQTRTVPTPLLEYLFESIGRRKFNFTWKLYPRSPKEAANIYEIIYLLKKNAHPALLNNNDSYYLKYPNIFKIRHKYMDTMGNVNENLYLNRIKPCALESIKVNYTDSNGFIVFDQPINLPSFNNAAQSLGYSNAPIGISIDLQFAELELLLSDDFDYNFNTTSDTSINPIYDKGGY